MSLTKVVATLAAVLVGALAAPTVAAQTATAVTAAVETPRGEPIPGACVYAVDVTSGTGTFLVASTHGVVTAPAPARHVLGFVAVDCATGRQRLSVFEVAGRAGDQVTIVLPDPLPPRWYERLGGSAPVDVALVGDSITEGYFLWDRAAWWVTRVQHALGDAVGGYHPVAHNSWVPPFDGHPWTTSGGTYVTGGGIAMQAWNLRAGQRVELAFNGPTVSLLSTGQPGGGVAEVVVDGVVRASLDTSRPALQSGLRSDLADLGAGDHTLEVRVLDPRSAGVTLEGALLGAGESVTVWQAGRAASSAMTWLQGRAAWSGSLAAAAPELIVVNLGTNDQSVVDEATYRWHLTILVDLLRQAAPDADIALMTPMGWAGQEARAATFANAARRVALQQGTGLIDLDLQRRLEGLTLSSLTVDGVHPNLAGSAFIAAAVSEALLPTG